MRIEDRPRTMTRNWRMRSRTLAVCWISALALSLTGSPGTARQALAQPAAAEAPAAQAPAPQDTAPDATTTTAPSRPGAPGQRPRAPRAARTEPAQAAAPAPENAPPPTATSPEAPAAQPAQPSQTPGEPGPPGSERPGGGSRRLPRVLTIEPPGRRQGPPPQDHMVVTHHHAVIGGQEIAYTATSGTLVLKTEDGRPKASIFCTSYTRDGIKDLSRRPITFAYNGGPGSASIWVHMGAFGPRRVLMTEEGMPLPPPYHVVDNDESLLDVTDLVFIDPVSTGYSREAPGEDRHQFHGLREDAAWVAEFIRLYLVRNGRWQSPKFLAGESYGTTRSAALSLYLEDRYGIYLNGIVLVSSILNFQTARFNAANDLPYSLFLPSYTATAWYHKRLPPDLQQAGLQRAIEESEQFALGDYTLALARGNQLPAAEKREVAARLSRLTGLSPTYLEQANLRPAIFNFVKELMRDQRKTVGRIDSRFTGIDRTATNDSFEFDPSTAATTGPFTAAFNTYVASELGFASDLSYEVSSDRVRPWSYKGYEESYANVAEDLREAMARNEFLRVMVANGYFDLATPFFATIYTFRHLGFDPTYEQRTTLEFYEAGHMMYLRHADRRKLKADIARFIASATPAGHPAAAR